ncbi:unnamed protein product [Cyclocybe aegerita]|uniref:Uncharacterized protein n=1 Tax=Cyclocybe aegerita TaxID=1973307 RepID=A0A8S0WZ99_CYCAE|nr:unnamed protein product [Cyclocybe aegerita]
MAFQPSLALDNMATQPPFMLIQQHQGVPFTHNFRNAPFPLPEQQQNVPSTPTANLGTLGRGSGTAIPQTSFRAPAHKHAHHLHSIPPREKSTRTLILDHMLWVHGRTRFAQARAELGMTDRTGGPSSPNYVHRRRPENYEEDEEEGSEGEEVGALRARAGGPGHPHNDEEEERLRRQDLALARSLRLRAEGLEKVVTSMLEQPPPVHAANDEDILTPPTSPKLHASSLAHPHRLPNGVRLRLALGTIINDLFARQAPPPPYRHTQSANARVTTPSDHSPSVAPSVSDLPDALTTFATVSGAFVPLSQQPPSSRPMQSSPYPDYPQSYPYNTMQYQMMPQPSLPPPPPPTNPRPRASSRTRTLYSAGADPSTANSPPAFRCPRHLHTGCEICVEAKSPTRPAGSRDSRGRSTSVSNRNVHAAASSANTNSWKAMPGGVGPGGGGITGWQDGSGIGSGLLRPGVRGSALRRKIQEGGDQATGAGNTKLRRREVKKTSVAPPVRMVESGAWIEITGRKERRASVEEITASGTPSGRVGTPGRTGNDSVGWGGSAGGYASLPGSPSLSRNAVNAGTSASKDAQAQRNRMYEYALRPSLEWYMLLAGLLTRAVLEGYLTAGWSGLQAVQCLLLVGLGISENAAKRRDELELDDEDDDEEEFDGLAPDELPNLVDAVKILFPSLRDGSNGVKGHAEEEYGLEMLERLKRFYDIPPSTPDCSTHMEDLAWQYPAEPVERGAVRFCEAVAKWRGKPELETKPPTPLTVPGTPGGSGAMTIESLVHSNPTSPMMGNMGAHQGVGAAEASRRARKRLKKPSIEMYFTQASVTAPSQRQASGHMPQQMQQPQPRVPDAWPRHSRSASAGASASTGNKRYRDADDGGRPEPPKRMYP